MNDEEDLAYIDECLAAHTSEEASNLVSELNDIYDTLTNFGLQWGEGHIPPLQHTCDVTPCGHTNYGF